MPNSKKTKKQIRIIQLAKWDDLTGNVIYYLRTQKTEKQHIVQAVVAYSICSLKVHLYVINHKLIHFQFNEELQM